MCVSMHCPMREKCYRATAKPDQFLQSYANFEYTCNEDSGFDDYIRKEDNKNDGKL